jgi:hypothetical protein
MLSGVRAFWRRGRCGREVERGRRGSCFAARSSLLLIYSSAATPTTVTTIYVLQRPRWLSCASGRARMAQVCHALCDTRKGLFYVYYMYIVFLIICILYVCNMSIIWVLLSKKVSGISKPWDQGTYNGYYKVIPFFSRWATYFLTPPIVTCSGCLPCDSKMKG